MGGGGLTVSSIERTLSAPITGPVVFDLTMPSGLINVTVTDTDRAEITLTTDAPADSPAGKATSAAEASTDARVMTVHVPTPAHDGVTIVLPRHLGTCLDCAEGAAA